MKTIKLINLFILALFYQVVFAQNNDIIKSFDLRMDKSVEKRLDSTNVTKALKIQFEIPENYEFKRQMIKGTKDKISEKDDLGYVHERYAQYYKGIKIEHSDIRVHYLNDLFVSANGEYIDASNIDISIVLSKEKAIEKAKEYIGAKEYMWENESENNWLKSTANDNMASFYPNTEIVICKNMFDFRDTTFYIAYKIDIYAKKPISLDYIFADAKNGNILAVNPILVNATGTAAARYSNGVCEFSANLVYNGESGAINESLSDIGELAWKIIQAQISTEELPVSFSFKEDTGKQAQMVISNIAGNIVRQISLQSGTDSITIEGGAFLTDVYYYSLYVENSLVDMKKMVLTK